MKFNTFWETWLGWMQTCFVKKKEKKEKNAGRCPRVFLNGSSYMLTSDFKQWLFAVSSQNAKLNVTVNITSWEANKMNDFIRWDSILISTILFFSKHYLLFDDHVKCHHPPVLQCVDNERRNYRLTNLDTMEYSRAVLSVKSLACYLKNMTGKKQTKQN